MLERLPHLPCSCTICDEDAGGIMMQIVPDRSMGSWRFDVMCPLCFDEFMGFIDGIFVRLRRREVLGSWPRRRKV